MAARPAVTAAMKSVFGRLTVVLAIAALSGVSTTPSSVNAQEPGQNAGICDRTPAVRDAIADAASWLDRCEDATEEDLARIGRGLEAGSSTIHITVIFQDYEIKSPKAGDFAGLTNVKSLVIAGDETTVFPTGIFDDLTSLQYLAMYGIAELPEGIFDKLTGLGGLGIVQGGIDSLPEGIFDNLTDLTRLWLDDNNIAELRRGVFEDLTNLKRLDLSDNSITSLPEGVFDGLANLKELYLQNNSITSLRQGVFDDLADLEWLNLDSNDLASLPAGLFSENGKLWNVSIRGTPLLSLPADFIPDRPNATRPFCLDLSYNQLFGLPGDFFHVESPRPVVVSLRNNPPASFPFFMQAELVSQSIGQNGLGTAQVRYAVYSGAPVRMEGELSVSGGTASESSVVVQAREVYSAGLTVEQSVAGTPVTLTLGDTLQVDMDECRYSTTYGESGLRFSGITFHAGAPLELFASGRPTISGTAQVSMTLTADTTGISDSDGLDNVVYSYQWLADDNEIDDETSSTYTVQPSVEGKVIKVRVDFTDDEGNEESLTSEGTAPVVVGGM